MKKLFLLLFVLVSCNSNTTESSSGTNPAEITTYYFIRHAEKDTTNPGNQDPVLTEEGVQRSAKWAQVFKEIPFDLIYSSDYKRTRFTAEAIANSQQKEVHIYNSEKLNHKKFQELTKGKTVLVVGHSNLNPEFINYILEEDKYKNIDEKEYGSLFIVSVLPDGTKTSKVLYIN